MAACIFEEQLDRRPTFEDVERRPSIYEAGCQAVGLDPFVRAGNDCRYAQPAVVALLLARWEERSDRSDFTLLVGEGIGELAALAAAGAISFYDAIWLAAVRGRLMSHIATDLGLAAIALRGAGIGKTRQFAARHRLHISRDAAPEQVVLAGRHKAMPSAEAAARELGIEVFPLPRHRVLPSPDFASARREWRTALATVEAQPPRSQVLSCATVAPVVNPRVTLADNITAGIRVRQSKIAVRRLGVAQYVTLGAKPNSLPAGR